jgi:hypothetical protein
MHIKIPKIFQKRINRRIEKRDGNKIYSKIEITKKIQEKNVKMTKRNVNSVLVKYILRI